MSEYRKKPGVAFWATVVLVGVLAYPLSFGPFIWIDQKSPVSPGVVHFAEVFYEPVTWVLDDGPDWGRVPLYWYVRIWGGEDWPFAPGGLNMKID